MMRKHRVAYRFLLCASLLVSVVIARAADVETLPAGVRTVQARYGVISGLTETWRSDSKLYNLGETRSINFDAQTLARVNPRARALVQALDQFGSQGFGSKINLGTLNVSTQPEIQFMAPVAAYGISDRWTIGVGVPVIRYRNKMSLTAGASNLEFYRSQFAGISNELDDALNIDLVTEARKVLAEKGYRTLESRDSQFVGDAQVAVLHRLPAWGSWEWMHQMIFNLPTGPKDDPDDLMALNSFSRTGITNLIVAARPIAPRWLALPYASLDVYLPDRVVKRVPKNEDDSLPDADSKATVARLIGPSLTLGAEVRWDFISRWSLKGGTEGTLKTADRYNGEGRMDLLSRDTDAFVQRVKGGLTFSTVESYLAGAAKVPGRVALEISDTVFGRNIERQLRTELSAMLFF